MPMDATCPPHVRDFFGHRWLRERGERRALSSDTMAPDDWHPVANTGTAPVHECKLAIGAKDRDFVRLTVT